MAAIFVDDDDDDEEDGSGRRGGGSYYVRLLDGDERMTDDAGSDGGDDAGDDPMNTTANFSSLAHNTLGFWGGVAVVITDIIGSGIFASPGIVLHWSGSVGASLTMWILAGIITYVGFACLAELSVMEPSAGGIFYYLRVNFGG